MTYPDRFPASTSVPYSQTTKMGSAMRLESAPGRIPGVGSAIRKECREQTSCGLPRRWRLLYACFLR